MNNGLLIVSLPAFEWIETVLPAECKIRASKLNPCEGNLTLLLEGPRMPASTDGEIPLVKLRHSFHSHTMESWFEHDSDVTWERKYEAVENYLKAVSR